MKFVFIFFLTFFSSLLPDTVSFKSGKIDENVKARMQKRTILIQYEDGRSAEVSKKEIKQVKFSSVVWNTKIPENLDMDEKKKFMEKLEAEEEARLANETQEGSEWIERPENEQISPWANAGLGLIPGYSGMYRTGNNVSGINFSMAEVGLLSVIAYSRLANKAKHNIVGEEINKSNLQNLRNAANIAGAALIGILSLDAYLSYDNAVQWNTGTYIGEKYPIKPSSPLSRLWRSAIFPGWGQIYAKENAKGSLFLGSSILLISTQIYMQNNVNILKNESATYSFNSWLVTNYVLQSIGIYDISVLYSSKASTRTELKSAQTQLSTFTSVFLILYTYNLIDAYFNSGVNPDDKEEETAIQFKPNFSVQPVLDNGIS
ncbi:MAG TPA: DUF5683 domain-containing protein, partial [Leptospiraceae bacterium]|nr:DUF5683 domain-containing protein [Leptospiraceae bacterium]